MRTPEENWRRSRGVIGGPAIGLVAGILINVFVPSDFPTGVVYGVSMGTGLALGAAYDVAGRRREKQAPGTPPAHDE